MEDKKLEYLKKHLTQALNEEKFDEVNYCYQELGKFPDADISEFTKEVNSFNENYKSKIENNCLSELEYTTEQLQSEGIKLRIKDKIRVWGFAGGALSLILCCVLLVISTYANGTLENALFNIGIALCPIGIVGIVIGVILVFANKKSYSTIAKMNSLIFNKLCESQEKLKYLDNVETINASTGTRSYFGQVFNGKKEGFGVSKEVGYYYIGEWHNDEKTGIGKLLSNDFKMTLEGEFSSDFADGIVDIIWKDGSEWHGEYKKGFPWNGQGKAILSKTLFPKNGNSKIVLYNQVQSGSWVNGVKNS